MTFNTGSIIDKRFLLSTVLEVILSSCNSNSQHMMYCMTLFWFSQRNILFSINKNEPKKSKMFFLHCFFWKTTCRLSVLIVSLKPQFLNVKLQLNFSIQLHNERLSMTETGNCAKSFELKAQHGTQSPKMAQDLSQDTTLSVDIHPHFLTWGYYLWIIMIH